jgi:hypothetical protein
MVVDTRHEQDQQTNRSSKAEVEEEDHQKNAGFMFSRMQRLWAVLLLSL